MDQRYLQIVKCYSHDKSITAIQFDEEDCYLAAGLENGIIYLYNLLTQQSSELGQSSLPISGIRWRSGARVTKEKYVMLSSNVDGTITHWNASKGQMIIQQKQNTQIYGMDLNKENTMYAVCGQVINVYDEETQSQFTQINASDNRIYCVKFTQDQTLLSGGLDQRLNLWDLRSSKKIWSILGLNVCGETIDVQDNKILVGQSKMKDSLQIWDIRNQSLIQNLDWNQEQEEKKEAGAFVLSCQFSKLNKGPNFVLAGSSGANEIGIFEKKNEKYEKVHQLDGFKKGIYSVDWCNLSNKFGLGSGDGKLMICAMK